MVSLRNQQKTNAIPQKLKVRASPHSLSHQNSQRFQFTNSGRRSPEKYHIRSGKNKPSFLSHVALLFNLPGKSFLITPNPSFRLGSKFGFESRMFKWREAETPHAVTQESQDSSTLPLSTADPDPMKDIPFPDRNTIREINEWSRQAPPSATPFSESTTIRSQLALNL